MTEQNYPQQTDPEIEVIDVELFTSEGRTPPHGRHYKVKIGADYYVLREQFPTGMGLLEKTGITHPRCHRLFQVVKGCELEQIELDQRVDLARPGIEHFMVADPEFFEYSVDDEPQKTHDKERTPNVILDKAGISPVKDYYLVRLNYDGSETSFKDKMDHPIPMLCPPVKYISIFKGTTPVS